MNGITTLTQTQQIVKLEIAALELQIIATQLWVLTPQQRMELETIGRRVGEIARHVGDAL